MKREQLTEKLLDIKREKGWTWKHITDEIGGMSPVMITGGLGFIGTVLGGRGCGLALGRERAPGGGDLVAGAPGPPAPLARRIEVDLEPGLVGGVATLISHGDVYCTDDTGYQRWRRFSRNAAAQAAVLATIAARGGAE